MLRLFLCSFLHMDETKGERNMKNTKFNPKIMITLLIAGIIGFSVSLLVSAIGGYLIDAETVGEGSENAFVALALLMGGLSAAIIAIKRGQSNRLAMSLGGAGAYFLVLLCCSVLAFDGIRSGVGVTVLMVLGSALIVWIFGLKGNKKAKYRLPKLR